VGFEPTTLVLIGTDYINYLMVTTTTAPEKMTVFAGELHVLLSTLVKDHLVKMDDFAGELHVLLSTLVIDHLVKMTFCR
jgi:hypothetical protein